MSYFSRKIRELRTMKEITGIGIEKALGLSNGSWSTYERSLTVPNLFVSHKIADFFGVSLDELVGRDVDKSHVTVLRFKQALEKLGAEEYSKAWHLGKKVWDLISIGDDMRRRENMRTITIIVNLLQERKTSRDEDTPKTSSVSEKSSTNRPLGKAARQ